MSPAELPGTDFEDLHSWTWSRPTATQARSRFCCLADVHVGAGVFITGLIGQSRGCPETGSS
jgi:hypothetical protein